MMVGTRSAAFNAFDDRFLLGDGAQYGHELTLTSVSLGEPAYQE